jgi:hypothetical protein
MIRLKRKVKDYLIKIRFSLSVYQALNKVARNSASVFAGAVFLPASGRYSYDWIYSETIGQRPEESRHGRGRPRQIHGPAFF